MKGVVIVILLIIIVSFYINAEWTKDKIDVASEQIITTTGQYINNIHNNTYKDNSTTQKNQ